MYALFEDGGKFLAGRVMTEAESSAQIELESGKRVKVKAANVLLKFEKPAPAELIRHAQAVADGIELELAWEFAPDEEFGFADLARDYFSDKATLEQQAGALFRLFDAPHYFRRAGKGRFKKAPAEILQQALVAIEKKKQVQQQIAAWAAELGAGNCPPAIREQLYKILFKPDKNAPEYKAVVDASRATHMAPIVPWASGVAASGEVEKVEDRLDVIVEIAQGMVAAFQQRDACAGIARDHLSPVQHLVPFRDHGEELAWVGHGAGFQRAELVDVRLFEDEVLLRVVPGGLLADRLGQVACGMDSRIEQDGLAAGGPGHERRVEAAERRTDHGHVVARPGFHPFHQQRHRRTRGGRQLRTPPGDAGMTLRHPARKLARLGRLRRRTESVQVQQVRNGHRPW